MAIPYSENLGQKKMIQTGTLPKLPRETGKNIFQPTNFLNFKTSWWFQHVSTPLKNISQIESFPQIGMKIKNIPNHHPENVCFFFPGCKFPLCQLEGSGLGEWEHREPTKVRKCLLAASMAPWLPKGLANCKGFYQNKTSNVGIIPNPSTTFKPDPINKPKSTQKQPTKNNIYYILSK